MNVHVYIHNPDIIEILQRIESLIKNQGVQIMAAIDDLKTLITDIGNDITEIDGDLQEILDKLAGMSGGASAQEVAELNSLLTALKSRTRATADKVPEPPATEPPTP